MTKTKAKNGHEITVIEDPMILEFLGLMKKGTKRTYESYFRRLLEFDPSISGQKMLDEKDLWEKTKLLQFKGYLREKGFSKNLQKSAQGAIRGFFSNNRKPLCFTRAEKKQVNEGGNESEGIFFSRDEMIRMWSISTITDLSKWVLCNKSLGLRAGDFAKITYGQLRGIDFSQEAPIFFGKINTGKENVIANVFLDSDVIHTVQELLELHKDAKNEERVFPHREDYLSRILRNLAVKAQINVGDREISFHAMRRFLYDRLTNVMSDDKARMIVGKTTKESAYISTQELREQFKKVLAEISVNGNNGAVKAKVEKLDNTVESLVTKLFEKEKIIEDQNKTIDELKTQVAQNNNTMNKMLSLPTIAREMLKAKEKTQFT